MKNKQHGFTIVEVIVTGAIIAILSAVAIPVYTGYVQQSRQDAVSNLAQTASAAANVYYRKVQTALPNAEHTPSTQPLNLFFDNTKFKVEVVGNDIRVTLRSNTTVTANVAYK